MSGLQWRARQPVMAGQWAPGCIPLSISERSESSCRSAPCRSHHSGRQSHLHRLTHPLPTTLCSSGGSCSPGSLLSLGHLLHLHGCTRCLQSCCSLPGNRGCPSMHNRRGRHRQLLPGCGVQQGGWQLLASPGCCHGSSVGSGQACPAHQACGTGPLLKSHSLQGFGCCLCGGRPGGRAGSWRAELQRCLLRVWYCCASGCW